MIFRSERGYEMTDLVASQNRKQFGAFDEVPRYKWFASAVILPPNWVPVYAIEEDKGWEARMYFDGIEWHELDKDSMSLGKGFYPDYWMRQPMMPYGGPDNEEV
jgi:hypothetical protein